MMRFIWNHPLTTEHLKAWSADSEVMIASFFFWNSGTTEQRSQVGLLRSLLLEVLDHHRDFIPKAFHEEWERKSTLATHDL